MKEPEQAVKWLQVTADEGFLIIRSLRATLRWIT
jgi:hypothetical protein